MTPRRAANSLVTRFVAIGLILLIIGSAVSYYRITGFLREDLEQSAFASQQALAGQVASHVDARLNERGLLLERLAAALPPPDRPEPLRAWLAGQQPLQPAFPSGLLVADVQGRIVTAVGPAAAPGSPLDPSHDLLADPGFRAALDGRTALGRAKMDPASQQAVLPIATPVWDATGRLAAVLIGVADLATLVTFGNTAGPRADAHAPRGPAIAIVSRQDWLIVAASDTGRILAPPPSPGQDARFDRMHAGSSRAERTIGADGSEELSAAAPVGSTGWYAWVHLPARDALAAVERTQDFLVRLTLTRAVLVLLVVGVLIAWLLRPLYRTARLADAMTRGELPLSPLPAGRADEVGHLTASFNRLLDKLALQQQALQTMAHHDELTGLPNRKLLADRLRQALSRAGRNRTCIAVLFLDLDGFKAINDTQGHEAGDEALRQVAGRLSALVRQADTLARLGGDEFVLLAPDIDKPPEGPVRTLAGKCIAAVARPIELQGIAHTLDVSIGIAVSGGNGDPDSLLAAADRAMYEAKRQGRGRYVLADAPTCSPA